MLQRILALPQETQDRYDLARVKVVASSGSALPGDLAINWMDQFGDNLYTTYGSTEVAYAAIAGPGRPPRGPAPRPAGRRTRTVVKILDDQGEEVPKGESGRIFVGNGLLFEGYTGGGHKEIVDGLMSSGDVGRFGDDGRLYIEGRDDEMIVSGGENVFPKEVEDCLARHDAVDRGRRDRRRRRRLRQAAAGLRRALRRLGHRGRPQGLGQGEPRPLQGAARDRLPRRAAPQRHRQGAQARARHDGGLRRSDDE